jgi:hypothetical protein
MNHRARVLAALLALFAFTAAFAEQVWASTCAPASVETQAGSMRMPGSADAQGQHGSDQDMPMPGHGRGHSRAPTGGDCPFQAIAASGCVFFSFPSTEVAVPDCAAVSAARMLPAAQAAPDLLLAFPHFRPPQA